MKKQKPKKPASLAERIEAIKDEADKELDRLAELRRPTGAGAVPAGVIRQLWEARAGAGNVVEACLIALKEAHAR
jgi:hypothetical protein